MRLVALAVVLSVYSTASKAQDTSLPKIDLPFLRIIEYYADSSAKIVDVKEIKAAQLFYDIYPPRESVVFGVLYKNKETMLNDIKGRECYILNDTQSNYAAIQCDVNEIYDLYLSDNVIIIFSPSRHLLGY
ncbi:MAG: hypothetical protein IAE99_05935 [Rhodothermales bacterium]|nr:hypothetical protein [Rhodothermales bacterium]